MRYFGNREKRAFTLAEVLITLGVIGVVAALTLPSVVNKINNKQLQTAFKAAYSIFSQAVINMREEEGSGLRSNFATYDLANNKYPRADEFYEKFYKYSKLNVIGKCSYSGKFVNFNKTSEAYTSYSNKLSSGKEGFNDALSNGMCANVLVNSGQINIAIDVNGTKRPNALGHDIFYFTVDDNDVLQPRKMLKEYTEDELEGLGDNYVAGDPCSYSSKQKGNGAGCAYYALIDKSPNNSSKSYWDSLP